MNFDPSINTILTVVFGATSVILVAFLQRQTEKLKIAEAQLSQSKYKVYHELVSIFFDILKDTKKTKKTLTQDTLMVRMIDLKKDLLIYGSDRVLLKLSEWLQYTEANPNDMKHIRLYLEALLLVRKDMGNRKTKITQKDIMLLIMQNEQEFDQIKNLL